MPEKKEALLQFHKERILCAAKQLFSEKGEAGTSMDDIAARADYSKSTIYVYFSGKEDIQSHLVLEDMLAIQRGIALCLSENAALEPRYFAVCRLLETLSRLDPQFLSRVLGSISVDEGDFNRLPVLKQIYDVGEQTNRLIERMFSEAIAAGEANADLEPVQAGLVFWSSICSLIAFSANKDGYLQKNFAMSSEAFLEYGLRLLLRSVRKENET